MDIREIQAPLKTRYREDAASAIVSLRAEASTGSTPMSCNVNFGNSTLHINAFEGVGGEGGTTTADVMLGALASCAQLTSQMVAAALKLPHKGIRVTAEGSLDLRGTLGVTPDAPVGFDEVKLKIQIDAPEVTPQQINSFFRKAEMCSVVLQTLIESPKVTIELNRQ